MSAGALVAAASVRVWAPSRGVGGGERHALGGWAPRAAAPRYQSARLRALADGYDGTALDGVRFVSSDASVVEVRGATAVGVAPGVAFVSLAASPSVGVTITVSDAAAAPVRLVGRVLTSASLVVAGTAADTAPVTVPAFDAPFGLAVAPAQSLAAEGATGVVAAFAEYADGGGLHALRADEFEVRALTGGVVASVSAGVHRVEVAEGATFACGGALLQVGLLDACGVAVLNASVPLTLDLPEPVAAELRIGAAHLAPAADLAAAAAVDGAFASSASVGATVRFADGSERDLSSDARVALALAPGSEGCAEVATTLAEALAGGGQLRIVEGAACDSVTVDATVTLGGGAYVLRASASVGIARFVSLALSAELHPAPQSGAVALTTARPLRYLHCTASHERARLSAAATLG